MTGSPNSTDLVVTAAPHPFQVRHEVVYVPPGGTVADVLAAVQPVPELRAAAHVWVGDWYAPPECWHHVRPKPGQHLTIRMVPGGGGGDGEKDPRRTVLQIAILAAAMSLGPGVGLYGYQLMLARTALLVAGNLLVNQILPPSQPQIADLSGDGTDSPTLSINGMRNRLQRFAPIPRVLGRHRMAPPYAAEPYTEIVGDDQYLRALFTFGYGPVALSGWRIGETDLFDANGEPNFEGVSLEVLDGGTLPVTFAPADVNTATDEITVTGNPLPDGMAAVYTGAGTPPAPLAKGRVYHVLNPTAGATVQLAAVPGGAAIDLTDPGSGAHELSPGLALFSNDVHEEGLSVAVTQALGWIVQTTQPDIDELSVDILFPQGLAQLDTAGAKVDRTVTLEVEAALTGTSPQDWTAGSSGKAIGAQALTIPIGSGYVWDGDVEVALTRVDRVVMHLVTGVARVSLGYTDPATKIVTPGPVPEGYVELAKVTSSGASMVVEDTRPAGAPFGAPTDFAPSKGAGRVVNIAAGTLVFSGLVVTAHRTNAVRASLRLELPQRGQYDVRVRRVTADSTDDKVLDDCVWTALRSITQTPPVNVDGLAMAALRIKATEQLNGGLDDLTAVAESILPDYTELTSPPSWQARPTRNPASLYRAVLQGAGNHRPIADSRLGLTDLESWHAECRAAGREFNQVRDFAASVDATLRDVARAGRASPAVRDGLRTIVRDVAQSVAVQHFTPRNSWGYSSVRRYVRQPHALRIRFANELAQWRQEERIVYDDGWDEASATEFLAVEYPGLTHPDRLWEMARYDIAAQRLRPEDHSWWADIEHIVCTRGDLVRVTHDVPQFGLGYGRVRSAQDDGGSPPLATHVVVDEPVTMEAGKSYAIRFRLADGSTLLQQVVTAAGEQSTLQFSTPFDLTAAPAAGDLFMFGQIGAESVELVVVGIEPGPDESARITAVDAAPAVHTAGQLPVSFAPGAVDTGTDRINLAGHQYYDGDVLQVSNDGSPADPPAPLVEATDYWVVGRDAASIQLAASKGGAAIDLTDGGSGTHTLTRQIPAFDSQLSGTVALAAPTIRSIRSDGAVLYRAPDGSWASQILIGIDRPSGLQIDVVGVEADFRPNASAGAYLRTQVQPADQGECALREIEDGETYDIRLRWVLKDGTRGQWTAVQTHQVEGKTAPPENVANFTAQQNGELAQMRWDEVPDRDLAGYELRYAVDGLTWNEATPLPSLVAAGKGVTTAAIPPGTWTLMIKAVDTSGNYSTAAATYELTVTPRFDAVVRAGQWPAWAGVLEGLVRHPVTGYLYPENSLPASAYGNELWDTVAPDPVSVQRYTAPEIDIGGDDPAKVWMEPDAVLVPGATGVFAPAFELDYHAAGGAYDGFETWSVGQTEAARYYLGRLVLDPTRGSAIVREMVVVVDLLEHTEEGASIPIAVGGTVVSYAKLFRQRPDLEVEALPGGSPLEARVASFHGETKTGFKAWVLTEDGETDVGGTINYTARGV